MFLYLRSVFHEVLLPIRVSKSGLRAKRFQGGAMQSHKVERHDFSFYYYR